MFGNKSTGIVVIFAVPTTRIIKHTMRMLYGWRSANLGITGLLHCSLGDP